MWLHSNGFHKIENIDHLKELRCLFLQRNSLTVIENLPTSLLQLDLSENNIKVVEGLSHLVNLTTLNLSKNALVDVRHLAENSSLRAVDLSHNQLAGKDFVDIISGIEKLTSLNMLGNPVCSKVAYFRKKMIVANKSLRYLDRPIFDDERATAEEWARAGSEAELKLKQQLQTKKHDEQRKATQEFRQWQESVRAVAQGRGCSVVVAADEDSTTTTEVNPDIIAALEEIVAVVETKHVLEAEAVVVKEEHVEDVEEAKKERECVVEPDVDDLVATTEKPLDCFVFDGRRKTLEELQRDHEPTAMTLSPGALSVTFSSDDDEVYERDCS